MATYEKWINNNTKRINIIKNPDSVKLEKMGSDYLLVVEPPALDLAINKKGNYSFTATERSWKVVPLTAGEISDKLSSDRSVLVSHTKSKAYSLIVAIIPEWQQRNHSARAIELQEIRFEGGSLTLAESIELQSIRDIFTNQVKPIRSASDFIESEIESGKLTTIDQIDKHIAWEA